MIRKLLPLSTLFVLAACSGDSDDAKPEDSGATTDTEEFTTTVDSGQGDDDDDAAPSTWTMTVPCDASHTLDTLVLDTAQHLAGRPVQDLGLAAEALPVVVVGRSDDQLVDPVPVGVAHVAHGLGVLVGGLIPLPEHLGGHGGDDPHELEGA